MAAALTLTDGTSANDLNLLDKTNIAVVEGGIDVLELPVEGTRYALVLKITGANAATTFLNQNKLIRMMEKAKHRAGLGWNPIVELNYTPDGGTQVKKYVYGGKLTTSPWEGTVMAKDATGRRTLNNVRLELETEPYWRGASEITVGPNLCDNSDFEWNPTAALGTTAPTGWTKTAGANWQGQVIATNRKYGRKCFRYTPSASAADLEGLYQDITVVNTQVYRVSTYVTPAAGTARLRLSNGAGGNLVTVDSSGTASQKLTAAAWTAAGTTLRVELLQSGAGIPDFYWDSVSAINSSTAPTGYVSGYTFDNQDVTLLDRNGTVIVAELAGDIPPLIRLGIENPSSVGYRRCWLSTRRIETSRVPLRFVLDTYDDADTVGTNGANAGSLNSDHVTVTLSTSYSLGRIAKATQVLGSVTNPILDFRPQRYAVYLRMSTAAGAAAVTVRLRGTNDNIFLEKTGIPTTNDDKDFIFLGYMWFPAPNLPNHENDDTNTLGLIIDAKAASGTPAFTCDALICFPADRGLSHLEEITFDDDWDSGGGGVPILVLENVSNPPERHYSLVSTIDQPVAENNFRFRGDWPELWPNTENRLCIWTQRSEDDARLDEQFRVHLRYVPRWVTPRGD